MGLSIYNIFSVFYFLTNRIFVVYTVLPTILLLAVAIIATDHYIWTSSEIHHFYIELFAVIFAGVIGFYYILHAKNLNDGFSLFIGIGFIVSCGLDLFHVLVSYSMMENMSFLKYFIPQTWFAGRVFLSGMLLMAIAKYSFAMQNDSKKVKDLFSTEIKRSYTNKFSSTTYYEKEDKKLYKNHNILIFYLVILGGLAGIIAFLSLFVIFPESVIDQYALHRPYEIPPFILFMLALFFFYKNKLYLEKDIIYRGILLYLIVDIFSQIIMSYSTASFDTAHNIAHVLKDVGYFINIIALVLSNIQYIVRLKERNEIIKNQYEKIKESEKIKTEFINIAAHELRTPIQPILALSVFLLDRNGSLNEYNEHINIIIRNAKRLGKLSEDLLDAAKIESNSLKLNKDTFDLMKLIWELIKDHKNHLYHSNSSIKLRFFYENEEIDDLNRWYTKKYDNKNFNVREMIIPMYADKNRIVQVLSNILLNSIKFTEKGDIKLILNKTGNKKENIIITIIDSGMGIDKDLLPHLFDKFITGSSSGTGLGLYISKKIVEAHGGKIWAENNGSQEGATIGCVLPLTDKMIDYNNG